MVIIAVHKYMYTPIDLICREEIKFLNASKLVPPEAWLISSKEINLLSKVRPTNNAKIRNKIDINVKKIIPDSLKVDANCFEISEPRKAPSEPPAAITPKTFAAPYPLNKLMITTQKIETTKKE